VEIFRPNRTDAYCIKKLRVVYLKIPTRKTGNVRRTFREDRAESRPSTLTCLVVFAGSISTSLVLTSDIASRAFTASLTDIRGGGMIIRSAKQEITADIASPHGIHGEMSSVSEAVADAMSSAI
jgi:hypothetical protein